jgi:hypothetical protein
MLTLTSNGAQSLTINTISIGGPDAADFAKSDTCHPPSVLQPKTFCSVSVTFQPATPGSKQASLSITDDAPGNPHSVSLAGTGVAPPPPAPAVTIAPNPINFPTITQGTSSAPLNITVTNSGNATLHISTVTVAGNNPADFSTSTANCSASTIAPNATCSLSVTFSPLAAGQRSETISLADDASDSPQLIQIAGNASPAINVGPATTGSTSVSVSAGATAQFQLQLTPGPSYAGSVTFTCSGAPLGANCQAPTLTISGGNPMPFTVTVTTSGTSHAPSNPFTPRSLPPSGYRTTPFLLLLAALLCALFAASAFRNTPVSRRCILSSAFIVLLLFGLFSAAGCGGGSFQSAAITPTPPPVITPQGTSTLTVTPSATNSAGKPLQLSPIQLTLTVN